MILVFFLFVFSKPLRTPVGRSQRNLQNSGIQQEKEKAIMSSEEYWRNQVAQIEAEYEQIIQGLRDEVEKQQGRCSELVHEHAMQRATAAADVRDFCMQYVAEKQQQQRSPAAPASTLMANRNSNVDSIPLPVLLGFLHEYSHGLLQLPENRRKRERPDTSLSPARHRLRQRMLARHRLIGRDDYVLQEDGEAGQEGAASPRVGSPGSPLLGPSAGAPSAAPRYANAAVNLNRAQNRRAVEASPPTSTSTVIAGGGGDGGGVQLARSIGGGSDGPMMTASAFGLPTLLPR